MTDTPHLTALNDATRTLAASADFAEVLRQTLQLAAALVNADYALLVLFNKNSKAWAVHSAQGLALEAVGSRGEPGLQAAQTGAAVTHNSAVALPLKARGQVLGALQAERHGGLTPEDCLALETFVAAAALAIDGTLSKTDFVSTVTHELRLPMTSIKGYADLLRGGMAGPVSEMQQQLLDTVRNNVDWMNALVSDLGDIAKIETGRLKIDMELLDAAACVTNAVSATQAQFEAKTQSLAVTVAEVIPPIRADRKRLIQMLTYLLTNANRYTAPNGQIRVAVEQQGSFVRFAVTDNGIGMKPEDRAKLFTQFFRSEDQVVRDHKGWGLALHLVKRLAESFGGEVGAESEYGKGSTVWFKVPTA